MGYQKDVKKFIGSIPDAKLTNLPSNPQTLYKDSDFRVDMQGMTSDKPAKHNIQIQVNKGVTITTLKKFAPRTIAGPALVPSGSAAWIAEQVRNELKNNIVQIDSGKGVPSQDSKHKSSSKKKGRK